jgi:hypothetical protein
MNGMNVKKLDLLETIKITKSLNQFLQKKDFEKVLEIRGSEFEQMLEIYNIYMNLTTKQEICKKNIGIM